MAPFIDPVVKAYIEKNRRINDKKRRWNKFKTANPTVADGPLRVRFYSEVLTAKERTKLQPQLKVRYEAAGWKGWDIAADCPEEWANANYQYKLAKLVYLAEEAHQRKVMADGFEGVTFFHYQHFFEAMAADGTTVYARQCDIGGVASVSMNADLGLVGAFMVWDHPDNMQRQTMHHAMIRRDPNRRNKVRDLADPQNNFKDGNATAVHEFGHFLHLPHARPMGGAFEAAMHDANDAKCIMNYDPDALHLCGGCALRLRGWAFFRHGAVTGFSAADPAQPGKAPPAPADDRVTNVYTAFYTDFV
jgi:hypothetical protein